jgi:Zn-dependent protease with chaperone function
MEDGKKSLKDLFLAFIGSKWFVLVLGIVMICIFPITWGNFKVVWVAGQMRQFFWIPAVFIINVLTIGLCVYKFMSMIIKPKSVAQEDWNSDEQW